MKPHLETALYSTVSNDTRSLARPPYTLTGFASFAEVDQFRFASDHPPTQI